MSQFDFGAINTDETSGNDLAALLAAWRDAMNTKHAGTTRPDYIQPGGEWLDITSSENWLIKVWTGSVDCIIGRISTSTGHFTPYFGGALIKAMAGLDIGQGLESNAGALRVKLDGGSLVRGADGLKLGNTGVVAGVYATANVQVDEQGRIVAIEDGEAVGSSVLQRDIFTESGTWEKPETGSLVRVRMWGGGGGGGSTSGTFRSGGGGGAYREEWYHVDDLDSVVSVTIGAGGSMSGTGGNTSFGSYLTAYGGGPGRSLSYSVNGGGGAGLAGAGGVANDSRGGNGGGPMGGGGAGVVTEAGESSIYGGGGGSMGGGSSQNVGRGGWSIYGGGGGGGSVSSGTSGGGGHSIYGGGGGGGRNVGAGSQGSGGTSTFGGNGGANGTAGVAPGGGGGAGAVGARGECIVEVY